MLATRYTRSVIMVMMVYLTRCPRDCASYTVNMYESTYPLTPSPKNTEPSRPQYVSALSLCGKTWNMEHGAEGSGGERNAFPVSVMVLAWNLRGRQHVQRRFKGVGGENTHVRSNASNADRGKQAAVYWCWLTDIG